MQQTLPLIMTMQQQQLADLIQNGSRQFLPHLSVDCVVFGFHENLLKVLLLKMKDRDKWGLPGGFVRKDESVERAASRVLQERTGLSDIFLQQFHVFSDPARSDNGDLIATLQQSGIDIEADNWFTQRFLTIGFYALVEFSEVTPMPDSFSEACLWWDLNKIHTLMLDHNQILNRALEMLRLQLNYQPIGYNLLPEKFTMPELQKLYETILGKKLDRRNFQRKITGFGILKRWEERKSGVAHKAPYYYSFDKAHYQQALLDGLQGGW